MQRGNSLVLLSILTSPATKYAIAITLVLTVLSVVYYAGKSDKEEEIKVQNLETIVETRKKIDEAIINSPNTPDGAREWLLRRSEGH